MKKKQVIFLLVFIILLIAAFFEWKAFSGKKTINVAVQTPENTNSESRITNQESENGSQQSTVISNQEIEANTQTDKKTEIIQPKADNSEKTSAAKIIDRFISWGFKKADSRSIDTIVIHSNYNTLSDDPYSITGAIEQFKMYGVAAHYIIDRSGKIYQLVSEKNIAYHAGVSKMKDGRTDVNNFSIGIELMVKDSKDYPTDAEYKALNSLISDIKNRWPIKYVVGHADIAPDRKTDPWGIDWDKVNK